MKLYCFIAIMVMVFVIDNNCTTPLDISTRVDETKYVNQEVTANGNQDNIYSIQVAKQPNPLNDATPGMLYIIGDDITTASDFIFMTTTCNTDCADHSISPSNAHNCNGLFTKAGKVWYAVQSSYNQDCMIYINVKLPDVGNKNYRIVQQPAIKITDEHKTSVTLTSYLNQLWSTDFVPVYFTFNLVNPIDITDNHITQVITRLNAVDNGAINKVWFGTNIDGNNCNTQFPSDTTKCEADIGVGTATKEFELAVQYPNIPAKIYSALYVKNQEVSFTVKYTVNCQPNYVFDYTAKRCLPTHGSTIDKKVYAAPLSKDYYSSAVIATKGQANIFTLNVVKEDDQTKNSIPAVLYIADNTDGTAYNLQDNTKVNIYLTTDCNTQCTGININTNPDDDNNCNELFTMKDSVFTAPQSVENTNCRIKINIQVEATSVDYKALIYLYPIIPITDDHSATTNPVHINQFWKDDFAIRITEFDLSTALSDFGNVDSVITHLIGITKVNINALSFGTDNAADHCEHKFPAATNCATTRTEDGDKYNYDLSTKAATTKIYGFFNIKDNIEFTVTYDVTCSTNYQYNTANKKCISKLPTCNAGQYLDKASNTCEQCLSNCKTCSTSTTCDTCINGFTKSSDSTKCQKDFSIIAKFSLFLFLALLIFIL